MKNLYESIIDKKFPSTTARNIWLRKQKVKVIAGYSSSGHNYPSGEVLTLDTKTKPSVLSTSPTSPTLGISNIIRKSGSKGNNIYLNELQLVSEINEKFLKEEIAQLQKNKKAIDAEVVELRAKIKFIKEKGLKAFDEDTFKNWRILKEISENKDNLDSYAFAEKLTKLIRG